jgi:hypothetical protein
MARLIATDDKMIPPPAQRFMSRRAGSTVVEVESSHAIYVSQPSAVAKLIEEAAKGVSKKILSLVSTGLGVGWVLGTGTLAVP